MPLTSPYSPQRANNERTNTQNINEMGSNGYIRPLHIRTFLINFVVSN